VLVSIRALKLVAIALMAAGVVGTAVFSGIWTIPLTCSPFLLFGAATAFGQYRLSIICTIVALLFAVAYGIHSYYEAFWVHQHGEADGVAIIVVPLLQAAVALIVLIIAFSEWLVHKRRNRESRAT